MSDLTIIIPTWNQKDLLQNCLRSLRRQNVPSPVLVVDNGSTDSTEEMIKVEQATFSSSLKYLNLGSNRGFAAAVNAGIRSASTPFIALLNNDTEADKGWTETGIAALEKRQDFALFASRIINHHRRDQLDSAGDCYNRRGIPYKRGKGEPINRFREVQPVLGASGAAAFYRRTLFDEIGFFDEGFFMYLEDVDLSLRAQLAGYRCLYLPDAIVYHIEAASDKRAIESRRGGQQVNGSAGQPTDRSGYYSPDRAYWINRNRWQLMITYQPARHTPWLLFGWIHSSVFHLLQGGFFGSFLMGLAAGVMATPRALRKRFTLFRTQTVSAHEFRELLRKC